MYVLLSLTFSLRHIGGSTGYCELNSRLAFVKIDRLVLCRVNTVGVSIGDRHCSEYKVSLQKSGIPVLCSCIPSWLGPLTSPYESMRDPSFTVEGSARGEPCDLKGEVSISSRAMAFVEKLECLFTMHGLP